MDNTIFIKIREKVEMWAKDNAHEDYLYGSRQSYWASALHHNIITHQEYDLGAKRYGNLWTYRGD